jgi:ankyrin repeat protein
MNERPILEWMLIQCAARPAAVRALLLLGADINAYYKGWTPLLVCAQAGLWTEVRVLVSMGANLELQQKETCGGTALHWAVRANSATTVRVLLELGADPGAVDRDGSTPMHWALVHKFQNCIDQLRRYAEECSNEPVTIQLEPAPPQVPANTAFVASSDGLPQGQGLAGGPHP